MTFCLGLGREDRADLQQAADPPFEDDQGEEVMLAARCGDDGVLLEPLESSRRLS